MQEHAERSRSLAFILLSKSVYLSSELMLIACFLRGKRFRLALIGTFTLYPVRKERL